MSSFILSILSLFIFALSSLKVIADRGTDRLAINLDISEPNRLEIDVDPSLQVPNGTNYAIKSYASLFHVIGDVTDAGRSIIGRNPEALGRFVFVVLREDGTKYVRVTDTYCIETRNSPRDVEEFIRKPFNLYYSKIYRAPIEVDVRRQITNHLVKLEETQYPELGTRIKIYSVQDSMTDEVTIGTVRYGACVLDRRIEGLIERRVEMTESRNPEITIVSKYRNGYIVAKSYNFSDESNSFHLADTAKTFMSLRE
ncbi:signal peptide-containing protein [Theileria equi strain WA]|uniref:Signal peptide-containing protein n=1 Tax=Theileria equi strain WA TaxID=1537102 RepID=L0AWW6_THEEQ|nr:signal peptide-containing protein [Theileria equi strain WA]AFZ79511.1 signal peptide-containing protein [Theileria equi strain WA]|eukprot:XP_004829177.1 signal peptide-containing protein [Theileria equi strain WA]